MNKKDMKLLRSVCCSRREDVSGFVRRAIQRELARLSYGTEDEKKALGIIEEKRT